MAARSARTAVVVEAPEGGLRSRLLGASYAGAARLLGALPNGLRHAAAGPGGTAWYWLSPGQRAAALDNYSAALGLPRADRNVRRVARAAFRNYGRMLMDFLALNSQTPDQVVAQTRVDGLEHVHEAIAAGRGVIAATPHMGYWYKTAFYAAATGLPIAAVVERFPDGLDEAVFGTARRFGLKVIYKGRPAVRALTESLMEGSIVALACDLEQGPGVEVSFFGRRAVVPGGPAALAIKTGAALLPISQYTSRDGVNRVHVDPPMPIEGQTKESLMQRVIDRFEDFIRERPDHWYAFRPMFAKG